MLKQVQSHAWHWRERQVGVAHLGLLPVGPDCLLATCGPPCTPHAPTSGQPEGLDIYTDHLAPSERFLSLRRYWAGGPQPAMDLGYLLDEVMVNITPLDWEAVIRR